MENRFFEQPFDWKTEREALNKDVVVASAGEERERSLETIRKLQNEANRAQLNTNLVTAMSDDARQEAAEACAHAMWILSRIPKKEVETAQFRTYIEMFAKPEHQETLGFGTYVFGTDDRQNDLFANSKAQGLKAAQQLIDAGAHIHVISHAYALAVLAELRLNFTEAAKTYLEAAKNDLRNAPVDAPEAPSYVYQVIMASEGSCFERTLTNLAQAYNQLGEYREALNCFELMKQYPVKMDPIYIAYRYNVEAEAHIGLEDYDKAKALSVEAYNHYATTNSLRVANCFRTLLNILNINVRSFEPLEHLEAAKAFYKRYKNPAGHDFRVRLDNIFALLKERADFLLRQESTQAEATPMLETVLSHYLDVLEVNQALQDRLDAYDTEGFEQLRAEEIAYLAKAEQLSSLLSSTPESLTTRLGAIQAIRDEQEGLHALFGIA
ncbi:MAG: hypothetical protein P1U32_07310 [Legionellaceae bacterium]|nr:hypothetical protein [Legionellaceae bacterium]